ncbi:MAG: hypothetical protein CXZ00_03245 [Acidobacteria bacterium]|nr:MAG: hypothetical protein CXZ00_03245 [Acidobacteriota bacterium]
MGRHNTIEKAFKIARGQRLRFCPQRKSSFTKTKKPPLPGSSPIKARIFGMIAKGRMVRPERFELPAF